MSTMSPPADSANPFHQGLFVGTGSMKLRPATATLSPTAPTSWHGCHGRRTFVPSSPIDSAMGARPHYQGPLYFEFDATNPADAWQDLRRCLPILDVEYGCPLEALHIWHSGGRGFHFTIPALVFGTEAGHPQLPRLYAAMIAQLFPADIAPTLDRAVYSMGKGRMWRLLNRRRSDTGRYKVPLPMREVLHKPYTDFETFTLRPRKGVFWPGDEDLSPCLGLVQLYQETIAAIERHEAYSRPHVRPIENIRGYKGVLFHAFRARRWLGQEIGEGKSAVICPWQSEHTSTILFAPGDGELTGWFYCSHGHYAERTLQDVLSLFTPGELAAAKAAAGLTGHDWHHTQKKGRIHGWNARIQRRRAVVLGR
jgi:hypothetical protein